MFDRYFSFIYDLSRKYRNPLIALLLCLTIAGAFGLTCYSFKSGVELMLPDEKVIRQNIGFLREPAISNKIIISLGLTSEEKNEENLFRASDRLAASLTPPSFLETYSGVADMDMLDDLLFSDHLPQVITGDDLNNVDLLLTSEAVAEKLRRIYMQLMRPTSMFMNSLIYADPLGLRMVLLERLNILSNSTGYDVTLKNGHFISRDGRHTLIITRMPDHVRHTAEASEILGELRDKLAQLPEYVSADVVSGHLHSVSNEKVIKSDIGRAVTVATIGFLLLFLIFFRDIRVLYVFLMPSAAVLLSINFLSLTVGDISLWVIGMGTVIAGIAVDYGIHVYVAVKKSGKGSDVIRHIAKPICMGALTTVGIFLVFFLSRTEGYHQLAALSIMSILLSLLTALFILPQLLIKRELTGEDSPTAPKSPGASGPRSLIVLIWAVSLLAASFFALQVELESDIKKLDGSEEDVIEAEENFQRVWGNKDALAYFIVDGIGLEDALETNDRVYHDAMRAIGDEHFSSLSALWPSRKTRKENMERWNSFWELGREKKLRALLHEEGKPYSFSEKAFEPFFDSLHIRNIEPSGTPVPEFIQRRFVQQRESGVRILSFFEDTKEYTDAMSELSRSYPETFIVSGSVLSGIISAATSSEGTYLATVAALSIIMLTYLFFGSYKKALLALVPVLTGILWLMGAVRLLGLQLNIANVFAGIVVMGLCIDYGIFMTYNYQHNLRKSAIIAISISAVTTLMGSGVLLFAKHPALFSSGITLFIGILAGYISAIIVIPSLEQIIKARTLDEPCEK